MKTQNRVSQLTLELYNKGLTTRKETKQVEKALLSDPKVRERYETLKQQEREINRLVEKELSRLNIQPQPPAVIPAGVIPVWGLAAAAAVILGVGIPVFLHFKNNSAVKNDAVAEKAVEETAPEDSNIEENAVTENTPVLKTPSVEQPDKAPKIAEPPKKDTKPKTADLQPPGKEIAVAPAPDTGVKMRGQNDKQDAAPPAQEEDDESGIPPGITTIYENMFANSKTLYVAIIIPDRIRKIEKNAYAGHPAMYVKIGANVDVDAEAIPGNFAEVYNANGKAAGVYTRRGSGYPWIVGAFEGDDDIVGTFSVDDL